MNGCSRALYVVLGLTLISMTSMKSAMAAGNERAAQMKAKLEERFAEADVNGDGKLTKEEAKNKMPRIFASFDNIDTEHTGYITLDQIEQYIVSNAGKRKGSSSQ